MTVLSWRPRGGSAQRAGGHTDPPLGRLAVGRILLFLVAPRPRVYLGKRAKYNPTDLSMVCIEVRT